MSNFTPIPVTRSTPATPRTHADVTYGFNSKNGALSLVLAPTLFTAQDVVAVGDKVIVAFDPATKRLLISLPESEHTPNLRTIRPRAGFPGAGTVVLSAQNLPDELPRVEKRTAIGWESTSGGVILNLSELAC